MESSNMKPFSQEEKEAASFLRERFLYFIASLPNKLCTIKMHNETEAFAQIRAVNLSFENVLVDNLKLSNSQLNISKGILRTSDILSVSFEDI
ncbi:hypothetical protein ABEB36_009717 [Hypothenemus hampei]|uniref:Gem-associated protein 7 n=1 Tax=Hypothenemus hampei TaxID=57062 RepID=A0ABD1EHM7_HYPHA